MGFTHRTTEKDVGITQYLRWGMLTPPFLRPPSKPGCRNCVCPPQPTCSDRLGTSGKLRHHALKMWLQVAFKPPPPSRRSRSASADGTLEAAMGRTLEQARWENRTGLLAPAVQLSVRSTGTDAR
jgi:hypothetical protein